MKRPGHVRIFEWNGSSWNQLGSDIDGEKLGDGEGYSVSLNATGNRVAIGAPFADVLSPEMRIAVELEYSSGMVLTGCRLVAILFGGGNGDQSGRSVLSMQPVILSRLVLPSSVFPTTELPKYSSGMVLTGCSLGQILPVIQLMALAAGAFRLIHWVTV